MLITLEDSLASLPFLEERESPTLLNNEIFH